KALGPNLLPTGFFKAYRRPLAKLLIVIVTTSLWLGHFPVQFKVVKVVVLHKPGKTLEAYRLILLLNAIGKVIESVISRRFTKAIES
ncbi:hypothetical protein M430DRAFT_96530, partial [Amorphotheca resinae ATCC 22711]